MDKIVVFLLLTCVCLGKSVEFFNAELNGERIFDGDFLDAINATQCFKLLGGYDVENRCYCRNKRPIFTMKSDNRSGCYDYKSICPECSSYQEASVIKQGDVEILNTTTNGTLKEMISSCESEMRVAALSIIHYSQKTQVYIGKMQYTEQNESAQVTLEVPVNITTSTKLLLQGKLATLQMWCLDANVEDFRDEDIVFLKISGQFNYPDNDEYVPMTTTTTTTTPLPPTAQHVYKKKGSKDLIYYVVIPVAAFMLLVAIIILIINCREKKHKKHSYSLRSPDNEKSVDSGVFNLAFQTTTLRRYNEENTLPNRNDSTRKSNPQKVSDDIKIYTIVDLSQPLPPLSKQHDQEPPSYEKRVNQKNYFPLFDETFTDEPRQMNETNTTDVSFFEKDGLSREKDDNTSIIKHDIDSDVDSIAKVEDRDGVEGDRDSIRKYSFSSTEEDNSDEEIESACYHSDDSLADMKDFINSDDIEVEILKPPPPPEDIDGFVVIDRKLI